jgi:hypothetical protein
MTPLKSKMRARITGPLYRSWCGSNKRRELVRLTALEYSRA